jgi:hypothetical protein
MLIISHRGNVHGPNILENHPDYIWETLIKGYDVEIDIWYKHGLYLGHDYPQYKIDFSFLNNHMWLHCKNIEAFNFLSGFKRFNSFMHDSGITKSTHGFLMVAPGLEINNKSIVFMPELVKDWDISKAYGVCTDYPEKYEPHS